MSKFHKVKSHKWENGQLATKWDFFNSFEEAKAFAESQTDAQSVKVYTDTNELVHSVDPAVTNTYA
jgi:viroplasmin and RNaseH domain-containing protein